MVEILQITMEAKVKITKPSNPQTGDASILGFAGVGIASIAGIFANNRRRKK